MLLGVIVFDLPRLRRGGETTAFVYSKKTFNHELIRHSGQAWTTNKRIALDLSAFL